MPLWDIMELDWSASARTVYSTSRAQLLSRKECEVWQICFWEGFAVLLMECWAPMELGRRALVVTVWKLLAYSILV